MYIKLNAVLRISLCTTALYQCCRSQKAESIFVDYDINDDIVLFGHMSFHALNSQNKLSYHVRLYIT